MSSPPSLVLSVRRKAPELIAPVKQTPRELKKLSDIDDQEGFRFQGRTIFFYKNDPSMKGKDPVSIIREALGRALVYYYPLAGRLREGPNRKLMVDCTGEGILFIEADANITLEQLGDAIQPPCPYVAELLYNVPGSEGILDCPLILSQVTRLKCGGFILTLRFNHTMCDAPGLSQFLDAVAEIARGCHTPSVLPVWHRELFNAREPPCITRIHHEYEHLTNTNDTFAARDRTNMSRQSFFFGPQEIKAMRDHLPPHLKNCTKFELLTACIWKCRTVALELNPDDIVRVSCNVNVRGKLQDLKVPPGYYGNAFVSPAAVSVVNLLCKNPLGYAVELVKKAKAEMSEEYIKSVADLMVIKGRPPHTRIGYFIVSDNTHTGFGQVNFGWGKPVYGGPVGATSLVSCFYMRYHKKGIDGIVAPLCLPLTAMEKFQEELKIMTQEPLKGSNNLKSIRILSTL